MFCGQHSKNGGARFRKENRHTIPAVRFTPDSSILSNVIIFCAAENNKDGSSLYSDLYVKCSFYD